MTKASVKERTGATAKAGTTVSRKAKAKARKRRLLFERQGGRCHWCGEATDGSRIAGPSPGTPSRPNDPTLDHLLPRSRGGGGGIENLVLACRRCNLARQAVLSWNPLGPRDADLPGLALRLREIEDRWCPVISALRSSFGRGFAAVAAAEDIAFLLSALARRGTAAAPKPPAADVRVEPSGAGTADAAIG